MEKQREDKLPEGWALATVGDVTIPVEQRDPDKGEKFSYIEISSINNKQKKIVQPRSVFVSQAPNRAKQRLTTNDVLVSLTRPNLNAVAIVPENLDGAIGSTGFQVLRSNYINPYWLFYFVQTSFFIDSVSSLVQGALYPAVRSKDILNLKIPIPPLTEQKRIVEEIDTQFSRLDEVFKLLRRMEANLRKLRASILKCACEGKLVPLESVLTNKKFETGQELLNRLLSDRRSKWESVQLIKMQEKNKLPKDDKWKSKYNEPAIAKTEDSQVLPEGWVWTTLEQISWDAGYGTSEKTDYHLTGLPILRIPNISNTNIDTSDLKRANSSFMVASENTLKPSDFLIIRTNGSKDLLGRGALIEEAFGEPYYFASYLIRFRLLGEKALHKWVALVWNSSIVRNWIESKTSTTAGQYNINLQILNSLKIPLPPINELKRITDEVEHRFQTIDQIEKVVETNLERADHLRRTILQDALNGKLVKQYETDESAEQFLERIKKEKEAKEKSGKKPSLQKQTNSKRDKIEQSIQGSLFSEQNSTRTMNQRDIKPPRDIKLLELNLEGEYKSLLNFEQKFRSEDEQHSDISPICLVGLNGSGKSNLIEALSEIFCYLELTNLPFKGKGSFQQNKQRDLQFEIEYELSEKSAKNKRLIKITKERGRPPIFFEKIGKKEQIIDNESAQLAALPKWIIGYSSGLNETISIPYSQIQYYYSQDVGLRALQEDSGTYTDIRTLFMDYDSNAAILIANYLLGSKSNLNLFREKLRIDDITSFNIVFQLDRGSRRDIELTNELKKYKELLSNCAFDIEKDKNGKYLRETFKFKIDEKTRNSFLSSFKTAKTLFIALYKFSLLNSLALTGEERRFYLRDDVREGSLEKPPAVSKDDKVFNIDSLRLKITDPNKDIDYAGISDGEHQLIQVFGSIQLFDEPGTLFLLDEPESHFNPRWRREFVEFLNEIKSTKQQEFVISTHSPFVVSGCRQENVFHFERENDRVYCRPVDFETYGSSFEYLLTKLFKMESLISKQAFEEMREVIKSKDLDKLKEAVTTFGESFEKRFLYEEIARLKNQK